MDIKNSLDFRYDRYKIYCDTGDTRYDYARYGVLKKCLPSILFKGNTILVSFIQLLDMRIVLMLKYIDKLKHFKHVTWF